MIDKKNKSSDDISSDNNLVFIKLVDVNGYISEKDLHELNNELQKCKIYIDLIHVGGPGGPGGPPELQSIDFLITFVIGMVTNMISSGIYDLIRFLIKKASHSNNDKVIVDLTINGETTNMEFDKNQSNKKILKKIKKVLKSKKNKDYSDFYPKG